MRSSVIGKTWVVERKNMNLQEVLKLLGHGDVKITTDNVNKDCITVSLASSPPWVTISVTPLELLCYYESCDSCRNAIKELIALGAVTTPYCYSRCQPQYLYMLVEVTASKDMSAFMNEWCRAFYSDIRPAHVFIDYGAKPPAEWQTHSITTPGYSYDLVLYHVQVLKRVAHCRHALVALLYYCRQSAYPALWAGYRELAKWMWRMRGPRGVGPRSKGWELK